LALDVEAGLSDIEKLNVLLAEIAAHCKAGTQADKRHAAEKLSRLAEIATTLRFTIRPQR